MYDQNDIILLAERSREHPPLLDEIVGGLRSADRCLAGDCAELLNALSRVSSTLLAPHTESLSAASSHFDARVRGEATAALERVAAIPEQPAPPTRGAGRRVSLAAILRH